MNGKVVAVALAVLAILAGGAYLFYAPAHVTLSITDPPPQPYDSSITAIEVTFTRIDIHAAGAGNESGWYPLMSGGTVNLINVLNISQVLGSFTVPAGKYGEIRFFINQTIITVSGVNLPYAVPSANQSGFKVVITGGGFQVMGGLSASVLLDVAFKNNEILSNPEHILTPVASARVN